MEVSSELHFPAALTMRQIALDIHRRGGWVDTTMGLDPFEERKTLIIKPTRCTNFSNLFVE